MSQTEHNADERTLLMKALHSQSVAIPDLRGLFTAWRSYSNPHVDLVNSWIDDWLATITIDQMTKLKHRRNGNYVLSAAAYFPDTSSDKLFVLSQFQYWIFFWDDEIDCGGDLANDRAGTLACCAETKALFDACLSKDLAVPESYANLRPSIAMLAPILLKMREGTAQATLDRLKSDLHGFVDGVAREQRTRISDELPNAEFTLRIRADDIGVYPCITQAEYAMSFTLAEQTYKQPHLQRALRLSAELVVLVNELVSFQKEALDGQVENFVLLYAYQENVSLAETISVVVQMIVARYREFTFIEKQLINHTPDAEKNILKMYLGAAKALVTGTTWWSYHCERYFKPCQIHADGSTQATVMFPFPKQ